MKNERCVWVVEIWWERAKSAEWLTDETFRQRKGANAYAKRMRNSGYKFRVVKYVSTKL